ncbi:hypothetical protein Nepgr_026440 [Nepenthes gracilis]|uniref:Uncharacterized protein n=1 Tax=Nepenthes gracilis TaxID=150966 RepID=A0AAD3Y0E1_NEPGR|nr:hypothetical protein Nepgr_026440 [Nepenthes gracilis]
MRNRHLQRTEIDYVLNPPFRMFSARLSACTRRDKASEKCRENSQARVSNNQATHKTSPSGDQRVPSKRRNSDRSFAGSIVDSIIFERFAKELYSITRLLLMAICNDVDNRDDVIETSVTIFDAKNALLAQGCPGQPQQISDTKEPIFYLRNL